jgi:pentatricopeptide repeat protein
MCNVPHCPLAGKSNHQLWNELCELASRHPDKVRSLNVDAIIRGGLRRYTDQLGHLWCSLADYYVRSGLLERARDVYEEAIQTVTTVRQHRHWAHSLQSLGVNARGFEDVDKV